MKLLMRHSEREQRLLFLESADSLRTQKNPADTEPIAPVQIENPNPSQGDQLSPQDNPKQPRTPGRLDAIMREAQERAPTFQKVLQFEDRDLDVIAASKDGFKMSKEASGLRESLSKFIQEMEDGMKLLNKENPSFEQAFALMGRSIDRHIKPWMDKYENDPVGFLENLSQIVLHDQIERRRNGSNSGEERTMFTTISFHEARDSWRESYGQPDPETSYDKVLLKELKKGKTIAKIRAEIADENEDDRRGMEEALGKLRLVQNTLLTGMLNQFRQSDDTRIPGLDFSINPETLDISLIIKPEALQAIGQMDPKLAEIRNNPDKTMYLVFSGKTFRLHPVTDEADPLQRTYRIDITQAADTSPDAATK